MSFLRAYLIKTHGLPVDWAAQFSTAQLWRWHVTGTEPRRR